MIQPKISPTPDNGQVVRRPTLAPHDDLEIPPFAESAQLESTNRTRTRRESPRAPQMFRGLKACALALASVGLLGVLPFEMWFGRGGWGTEASHANWKYVSAAGKASAEGVNTLVHVDATGAARTTLAIPLSWADVDHETTRLVRTALANNDLATADRVFRAAQPPGLSSRSGSPGLAADPLLLSAIRDGRAEFFHLRVSDACVEDNDILRVSVNGIVLGETPLTHRGMVFSVPGIPGTTVVTLHGVHDGGGGITMKFESSEGHYFCRTMSVDESCITWVVIP